MFSVLYNDEIISIMKLISIIATTNSRRSPHQTERVRGQTTQSLWRITCPPPEQKHQELVGKTLWVKKHKHKQSPMRKLLISEGTKGPFGKEPFGKKGRKQRGLKHNETYRTPIFCTVPLPRVPLVPSNHRASATRLQPPRSPEGQKGTSM